MSTSAGDPRKPQLSDLDVERYVLGDLSASEVERLEHLHGDVLQCRADDLRVADEAFFRAHPPGAAARTIAARLEQSARAPRVEPGHWRWAVPTLVGAAVALALVWSLPGGSEGDLPAGNVDLAQPVSAEQTRLKGQDPKLLVYRKTRAGSGRERLQANALVSAGDVLQLAYVAGGRSDGVIISIDGRGSVTLHHPATPTASTKLEASGEQPLAKAFELDDAPEFERFIFVVAQAESGKSSPPTASGVLAAARAMAGRASNLRDAELVLPPGLSQQSFVVRKPAQLPGRPSPKK